MGYLTYGVFKVWGIYSMGYLDYTGLFDFKLAVSVVALGAWVAGLVASLVLSGSVGVGGCCVVCFSSW